MRLSFPRATVSLSSALVLSVLLCLPMVATAQQPLVDSLKRQWSKEAVGTEQLTQLLELTETTSSKDLDAAIALADYGIGLAEGLGEEAMAIKLLGEKGGALQLQSKFEAALRTHETSIEKSKAIGDDELLATCLNNKAVVLIDQGDYHGGLTLHLEVLRVREKTGDPDKVGYSCNYIAEDLYFLERQEESIGYAERAIELFKTSGNQEGLAIAYENIGWSTLEVGDNAKALGYIDKALAVGKQIDMRPSKFGSLFNSKGNVLRSLERYEEALVAFQAAYKIAEDLNYTGGMTATMGNIGDVYMLMERYEEALPYREKAVKMKEESGNYINYSSNLTQLSNIYKNLGDYESALRYQEKVLAFRDSTFNKEKEAITQELTAKYETEQKEEQLAQNEREQNFLYALLATLLLAGALLVWAFVQKQRSNKILTELNEQKAFLIKEVHHRVKNNLQVISSLLQFQSRSINNTDVKAALLDSQSRVESMGLIHKKLYRGDHLAAIEMKGYLSNLADTLIDAYSDEEDVDIIVDMDTFELDVDYAIPLGLIANELVTNSLKYAFPNDRKGAIKIQLTRQDDDLILSVADDGVGKSAAASPQDTGGGFGSELVDMLTLQLKGKLQQLSVGGLETQLRFPLGGGFN